MSAPSAPSPSSPSGSQGGRPGPGPQGKYRGARDLNGYAQALYGKGFNIVPTDKDKRPLTRWSAEERVPENEFKRALGRAEGIGLVAGPVNPFKAVGQRVVGLDVDEPSLLKKYPTLWRVVHNTACWYTGPRCPKCGEKHLEVLEPGRRFRCPRCGAEFTIEEAKRGIGAVILVSEDAVRKYLGGGTRRLGGVEIMVRNYQLIPPSLHPTGVPYEWCSERNAIDPDRGGNFNIRHLSDEEFAELLEELGALRQPSGQAGQPQGGGDGSAAAPPGGLRELSDQEVGRIANLLRGFYTPGYRQALILWLSGALAKAGVSPVSAIRVALNLYATTGDTDPLRQRLSAVAYTYGKAGIDLRRYADEIRELTGEDPYGLDKEFEKSPIKGLSGLREVIAAQSDEEEAERVLSELAGVLGVERSVVDSGAGQPAEGPEELRRLALGDDLAARWESMNYPERLEALRQVRGLGKYIARRLGSDPRPAKVAALLADVFTAMFKVAAVRLAKDSPEYGIVVGRRFLGEDELKRALRTFLRAALDGTEWAESQVFNPALEEVKAHPRGADVFTVNPPRYLNTRGCAIDLETLECLDGEEPAELGAVFTYELPEVPREFLEALREGRVSEDYFKGMAFYRVLRPFYEDGEWAKLEDALGAILVPRTMRLWTIVVGEPGTHKTYLNKLIRTALDRLAAPVSMNALLTNRFALEHAVAARALLTEEVKGMIENTELLKALVGGAPLPVDRKNKPIVVLENNAFKLWSFTNDLPILQELDDALLERIQVIFTREPEPGELPPDIDRLRDEALARPGEFLEFILYCYWRLMKRARETGELHVEGAGAEEVAELLAERQNNALRFLREYMGKGLLEVDPQGSVSGTELYAEYKAWCLRNGERPVGMAAFYSTVERELRKDVRRVRDRRRGSVVFRGLRLKPTT